MKKNDIINHYNEIIPKYKSLGENLVNAIEIILNDNKVQYLKVYYRVKEIDSFVGKIERKNYKDPFENVEDICGVRIICYYKSDIEEICELLKEEFNVLTSQDKEELLNADQFGYRSHHLIIKLKEEWLSAPNYKNLGDLKAEIQIRTNLTHTWAEIEHELGYKKEEEIPSQFRRKFSQLSALLEIADEQFESLKDDISAYREDNSGEFGTDIMQELNLDNLSLFLNQYFPEREENKKDISYLLKELKSLNIDLSQLKEMTDKSLFVLKDLEKEESEVLGEEVNWSKTGIVRAILALNLTDEEYPAQTRWPEEVYNITSHYKDKIIYCN